MQYLIDDDDDKIKDHFFGHCKEEDSFKLLTILFIGNNRPLFIVWVYCRFFYNR